MSAQRRNIQRELALGPEAKGEARSVGVRGTEAHMARTDTERSPAAGQGPSMDAVIAPGNLRQALARVQRNKGAPGVDGMTVDDLGNYLKSHALLAGDQDPASRRQLYVPQPVRRVEIPKASAGFACSAYRRCLTVSSSRR